LLLPLLYTLSKGNMLYSSAKELELLLLKVISRFIISKLAQKS